MADTITKVIEVKLDDDRLIDKIRSLNAELEVNKARQRELNNMRKRGMVDNDQYVDTLTRLTVQEKALKAQLTQVNREQQAAIRSAKMKSGSYEKMQAQLSALTKKYKALSDVDRESAKGEGLLNKIAQTTQELKAMDAEMGVFNRNVGNYQSAFNSEKWSSFVAQLSAVSPAAAQAATGIGRVGVALTTITKIPILLVIGSLVAAFKTLRAAFTSSEEAAMNLRVAISPFVGLFNSIWQGVQRLAEGISRFLAKGGEKFTAWISRAAGWIDRAFGSEAQAKVDAFNKKTQTRAEQNLQAEQRLNQLTKDRRANTIAAAEAELKVAELRYKANRKDQYSAEERLSFIKEASAIQLERAKEEKRLAEEELEIQRLKAAQTSNDKEANDALAEAEANVHRARTAYFNQQREMAEKIVSYTKEIEAERKAAHDKEVEHLRQLEAEAQRVRTATIALMADGEAKEIDTITNAANARANTLAQELADGNIQWQTYNKEREALEAETEAKLAAIRDKYSKERYEKAVALQTQLNEQELLIAERDGKDIEQIKLAQTKQLRESLLALNEQYNQAGYESELEFQNAILALDNSIAEQQRAIDKRTAEERITTATSTLSAMSSLSGAIMGLVDEQGEQSERHAAFAKAMAVFQIALNTAVGIAEAVKAGSGVPFPANIAAILSGITAVVSGIAGAKAALSESGTPPKYHDGGYVNGNGEVGAVLLDGESVMNRATTANFGGLLSELNVASGGNAIAVQGSTAVGDSYLAGAFRDALEAMPAPEVSVVDINKGQQRLAAVKTRARRNRP